MATFAELAHERGLPGDPFSVLPTLCTAYWLRTVAYWQIRAYAYVDAMEF